MITDDLPSPFPNGTENPSTAQADKQVKSDPLQSLIVETATLREEMESRRERYFRLFLMGAPMSFAIICAIAAMRFHFHSRHITMKSRIAVTSISPVTAMP